MKKYLIIDSKMRSFEKKYLKNNGLELIEIKEINSVYEEISSHVDIFLSKINNKIIVEPKYYEKENLFKDKSLNFEIIKGYHFVQKKYPEDIKYNICQIGNNVIHNFKFTDKKIIEIIEENNLNMINIKQGYSNCSIVVIDENSCIVTDEKIGEELKLSNIDVLIIKDELDIKLLKNDLSYSDMKGFIGGAFTRINNDIICFGDIDKIDKNNLIRKFINSKGLNLVDFKDNDVIDYGGALLIY